MNKITLIYLLFLGSISSNDTFFIEDFNDSISSDWQGRKGGFEKIYSIKEEDGNNYLAAECTNTDNFYFKKNRCGHRPISIFKLENGELILYLWTAMKV